MGNPIDWGEEAVLRQTFNDIDTQDSGYLSQDEIKNLFKSLNLNLDDEQFARLYLEMDAHGTGAIDYTEFRHWWYKKKDGMPHMGKCPEKFLDILAERLVTQGYDIGEEVVPHNGYGDRFGIILQGGVQLWRDHARQDESVSSILTDLAKESVFGFRACLDHRSWARVGVQTRDWSVVAIAYVDVAWISRGDLLWAFKESWPAGYQNMVDVAVSHYDSGITRQAVTTLDVNVDVKKFLDDDPESPSDVKPKLDRSKSSIKREKVKAELPALQTLNDIAVPGAADGSVAGGGIGIPAAITSHLVQMTENIEMMEMKVVGEINQVHAELGEMRTMIAQLVEASSHKKRGHLL